VSIYLSVYVYEWCVIVPEEGRKEEGRRRPRKRNRKRKKK